MGAQIVLYEVTGKEAYKQTIKTNVNNMMSGPFTPGEFKIKHFIVFTLF